MPEPLPENYHQTLRSCLEEIDDDATGLTQFEVGFIADLMDRDVQTFTPKQAALIQRLYADHFC